MKYQLMDWSNENVLEFIELIRSEPVIWDHKANSHPNRNETIKAWDRIQSQFSMQCPTNELKRKRNSLMTAYRDYVRKIKKTVNNPANYDEIYKPTWFAFDAINNFMGSKYGHEINVKSEGQSLKKVRRQRWSSRDTDCQSPQSESDTSHHSEYSSSFTRKRRSSHDQSLAKQQMNENLVLIRESPNTERSQGNEYDLYGQLLAEKLKKMGEGDRLMVMNEIDNLVFKYAVNTRSRMKSQTIGSASHQNYLVASGSGTHMKKKIKTFAQNITKDALDLNDLSSGED